MSIIHFHLSRMHSVKEMQDQFSERFPFLRINFFKNSKPGSDLSGPRILLFSPEILFKDINPEIRDGEFFVPESMTVLELEKHFNEMFGLSIQILRKSGNLWLDTSRTNSWTLKEQDDHGRDISPDRLDQTGLIKGSGFRRSLG
jgi:hypothetical protein